MTQVQILVLWPWGSYKTSLRLHFPVCGTGMTTGLPHKSLEDEVPHQFLALSDWLLLLKSILCDNSSPLPWAETPEISRRDDALGHVPHPATPLPLTTAGHSHSKAPWV